jgi:hypothetical protein
MTNNTQDATRRLAAPFDAAAVRWKPMKVSGNRALAASRPRWPNRGRGRRVHPESRRCPAGLKLTPTARTSPRESPRLNWTFTAGPVLVYNDDGPRHPPEKGKKVTLFPCRRPVAIYDKNGPLGPFSPHPATALRLR